MRNQVVRIPRHAVKYAGIEDNDVALAVVVEMVLGKVVVIVETIVVCGVHIRLCRFDRLLGLALERVE